MSTPSLNQKLAQLESIYRTTKQTADSAATLASQLKQEQRKTASLQTMVLPLEDAERMANVLIDKGMLEMTSKRAFCERVIQHPTESVDTFIKVAGMVGAHAPATSFGSGDGVDFESSAMDPMERFAMGM